MKQYEEFSDDGDDVSAEELQALNKFSDSLKTEQKNDNDSQGPVVRDAEQRAAELRPG